MSQLQYVGKRVIDAPDLVYKTYIDQLKSSDKSMAQIDAEIANLLSGYATVGFVNAGDAKNATRAYVDGVPAGINPNGGDAARLALARRGQPNGSVPLDATGRIPPNFIRAPLDQNWVRGPWTPSQYFSAPQPITAEATLYSCPVNYPGYPYKLMVFGHLDMRSNNHAEYARFHVREGSATAGQIVASGTGPQASSETVVPTSGEKFDTASLVGLGPDWTQFNVSGSGGSYSVTGGQAVWSNGGVVAHTLRYRRIAAADALTMTDYQRVRVTIGSPAGGSVIEGLANPQWIRVCARMNTAEDQWVGFELNHNTFTMKYCVGNNIVTIPQNSGGWVTTGSTISTSPVTGTSYDILTGTAASLRQFYFYRNNVLIGQALDANNVSAAGSGNRGWGWFSHAAGALLTQTSPPAIADLLITDAPPSAHHVSLIPNNPAAATVLNADTTLYIRGVRSGAASTQTVLPYAPKLTVWTVPV